MCSDQEAVDLVRKDMDPHSASKTLVEHALGRFSTDNLSCMIVRFNTQALQAVTDPDGERIGVDGDPASTVKGGISESEALVKQAAKLSGVSSDTESLEKSATQMIEEEDQEPGPELDPEGLKKAKEKAEAGKRQVEAEAQAAEGKGTMDTSSG